MRLDGLNHVTAITGDAPRNVDFYTGTLGLRLVTKTVNQDDPTVYHLFYADEEGSPGADLTFFEYPGAARGRVGAGCAYRVVWRVGSADSLGFWADRLAALEVAREVEAASVRFADPEGLEHAKRVSLRDFRGRHPRPVELAPLARTGCRQARCRLRFGRAGRSGAGQIGRASCRERV